jgi:diguanylate cyclase (GGDEF)-like protein
MTNYTKKYSAIYQHWTKHIVFVFFVILSNPSFAYFSEPPAAQYTQAKPGTLKIDHQTAKKIINDIRTDKIDYLKNEEQLQQVFEESKKQNWQDLHLEAAALYAELLFRQEDYEKQNNHINNYLENTSLPKEWDLYLLFLESKLKYLSRQDDQTPAKIIIQKFERWLPNRTPKEKIIIFRALAYYYTVVDDLKKTLNVALEGLELASTDNDLSSQGFFLRKISDAYNYFEEKDKALEYSKKAVYTYEKTQDQLFTSKAYWSLGNALLEMGEIEEALNYITKALSYFKAVDIHKGIVFAQYSIADIHFQQGNYKKALTLLDDNIATAKAAGVFDMQLASIILTSDIYIAKEQFETANAISDEVFILLDKFTRSIYKSNFLTKRYQLKRHLKLTDEAFKAIEQEIFYTKKHLQATSENNIKTLKVKFEVKQKEEQIINLEHEKNISELKVQQEYQQKIIWRLSAGMAFILVLVSLFLFYKQARQRKKYHAMSLTDYLTNSPNRRAIMRIAEKSIIEAQVTIAIVDLDYFKRINDTCGHDFGDLILIAFARAATKTLREKDKFGRYGGEEWLFILNTTDKSAIEKIFTRLVENFSNYCIDIRVQNPLINWDITFSMGAAISTSTNNQLDEVIKHADALLYQAKENGRNQLVVN